MTSLQTNRIENNGHSTEARSDFEQLLEKPVRPPTDVMAEQMGVPREQLFKVLRESVMPRDSTQADFMAFCQIAAKYNLNPFAKEIYVMPKKGGGIQVVVGFDGWVKIVQRHKSYNGCEFREVSEDGVTPEVTFCTIYRKDQEHPTVIPERFSECAKGTEPWKAMPFRMLRHKAYIQCARVAFGISGISDEDEGAIAAGYDSVDEAMRAMTKPARKQESPFKEPSNPIADTGSGESHASNVDQEGGNAVADRTDGQPIAEAPFDIEAEAARELGRKEEERERQQARRNPHDDAKAWANETPEAMLIEAMSSGNSKRLSNAKVAAKVSGPIDEMAAAQLRAVAFQWKLSEPQQAVHA